MKMNKKGYMLVEIIVSFVLAFSIAMYLLNLTIKFKDTNEEIYYSANYTKDRNLIVRNIMDDLEKGTVTYVSSGKYGNNNYVNFKLNINGVEEFRKLKIDSINNTYSIEYGKTDDTYTTLETSHSSYYKKSLNSGLIISNPEIVIDNNVFRLTLPVESMYSDESYDIKLIAPCYAVSYMKSFSDRTTQEAFRVNYLDGIRTVSFVNNMNDAGAISSGDFSDERNEGEVKYWITGTPGNYNLYIGSDNVIVADSLAYLFAGMTNLKEIDFGNLQTVVTTNMKEMFYGCSSLENLNLSGFDTSSVTDMSSMFQGASSLTELNLENFNTSSVEDMSFMFTNDYNATMLLEKIKFGPNFDTSKVKNMKAMFRNCINLSNINISSFDTSNVEDMSFMFGGYVDSASGVSIPMKFENIEFGEKFDTSKVTNMASMFSNNKELINLDLSKFNTSKVENMLGMFQGCEKLLNLNLSSFNTSKVTNMSSMFQNCKGLTELILGDNFNTLQVTLMRNMFTNCKNLTNLDLGSKFDTSNVTNMDYMFEHLEGIQTLNLSGFNTSKVTSMKRMFDGCYNLKELDLSSFNTSYVKNMNAMFRDCNNLNLLNLGKFDTGNVLDMTEMFKHCFNLTTSISIKNMVTNPYDSMFEKTSINSGKVIVNYTSDTSDLVDNMINTKSATSNVIKGELVS